MSMPQVHVYSAGFADEAAAMAFADAKYGAGGQASCLLWEAIGATFLDSDFVEVVHEEDRFAYLGGVLADAADAVRASERCDPTDTTFILVYDQANEEFVPSAPSAVRYAGTYPANL